MVILVPATSANLGPGFDFLGLALELYNIVEFAPEQEGCYSRGIRRHQAGRPLGSIGLPSHPGGLLSSRPGTARGQSASTE